MIEYLKSLINSDSKNSSKSLALLLSAVVGAVLALMLGITILVDVCKDGRVDMSLSEAGIYLGCIGAYMFAGGFNKILSERVNKD